MRTWKHVVLIATDSTPPTQEAWAKAILGGEYNGEIEKLGPWMNSLNHWIKPPRSSTYPPR